MTNSDAGRYVARMASRLRIMHLPDAPWVERLGDILFL
jgi:hypothetical protein